MGIKVNEILKKANDLTYLKDEVNRINITTKSCNDYELTLQDIVDFLEYDDKYGVTIMRHLIEVIEGE